MEGTVEDTPLLFVEKEIIAVTIPDAFVQGKTGIVSSYCEIYPNMGVNTDVCCFFYYLNFVQHVLTDSE